MDKTKAFAIGLLTFWPIAFHLFAAKSRAPINLMAALYLFTMVGSAALLVFCLAHLFTRSGATHGKKALWAAFLILGNLLVMPIYWYLFIWKRNEGAPPDAPSSATWKCAAVLLVICGISLTLLKSKTPPRKPPFGEAPLTAADVPRLIKAIESQDHAMQAAYALGHIGPPAASAVPVLITMVKTGKEAEVGGAIFALERIGPTAAEAIPILRQLSKGHDAVPYGKVHNSLMALGGIGDAQGIVEAASFRDRAHDLGIADAVRKYELRAPGMEEVLVNLFRTGETEHVRDPAAIALARIAPQTPGLLESLAGRLEKHTKKYESLAQGGARSYEAKLLIEIRTALKRIGSPEALKLLEKHNAPVESN